MNCLFSTHRFICDNVEFVLEHAVKCHQVECNVVNYQDLGAATVGAEVHLVTYLIWTSLLKASISIIVVVILY